MKELTKVTRQVFMLSLAVMLMASCAKQAQPTAGTDDILRYSFNTDGSSSYLSSSSMNQLIIAGGQEVAADVLSTISYSVTKTGMDDQNLKIDIRVDSIETMVKSMQGNMLSKPEEVKDVSFSMLLSEEGEESGLEGAAAIEYTAIGGEKANLQTTFSFLFPDLPAAPVRVGYTWVDNDTIDMSVSGQTVLLIINSNNTVVARESYRGFDCYKIEYVTTGERSATGDTPQGFMSSSGDLEGKGHIYFAINEGIVVQDHNEQKFEGELTLPTGDSFPMYMDIVYKIELQE